MKVFTVCKDSYSGLCLAYGPYRLMASPPSLSLCRMASPSRTKSGGNSELDLAIWSLQYLFIDLMCVLFCVSIIVC